MRTLPRVLVRLGLVTAAVTALGGAQPEPTPSPAELLKEFKALGLPLPPATAKLVRYQGFGGGIVNGQVQPPGHGLAFEVKPGTKTEKPVLLRGAVEWQPSWDPRTREVKPDVAATRGVELDPDDALVLAVQCQARGWDELARHLLDLSRKANPVPPRKALLNVAWDYWQSRITHPTADRGPAAEGLKGLMRRDAELDTEYNRRLVKSLDLALVPGKGRPGSIEALIDALVDYHKDSGTLGPFDAGDGYWRIAERGFDAVPALIGHLDDDRLTRSMMQGFNNFRPWHRRVGDVAGDLLEGLAAEELDRGADGKDVGGGWLPRQQGYPITKAAADAWWGKARAVGEEKYLLSRVLPPAAPDGRPVWVNSHLLRVLAAKYPRNLPALYRTALGERSDLISWELADALARSPARAEEKVELFAAGARHKDYSHRLPAFAALKDLDRKQFDTLLLASIEGLPRDVEGDYWSCPEAHVARLAVETGDPRVWAALEKAVRRSALGLRMELLHRCAAGGARRPERLRLLASYLDDAEVRDVKADKRFAGPGAGFPYDRIEVRDFAAVELARLLGIEVELKLDRTAEDWAGLRGQVREALRRERDGQQ